MDLLLPVTTMLLIGLGAFCIFTSIDNDRRIRSRMKAREISISTARMYAAPAEQANK